jgi:hypothetical protein
MLDTEQVTIGGNTVQRQRTEVAGSVATAIADVVNTPAAASAYGLTTRPMQLCPDHYIAGQLSSPSLPYTLIAAPGAGYRLAIFAIQTKSIGTSGTPDILTDGTNALLEWTTANTNLCPTICPSAPLLLPANAPLVLTQTGTTTTNYSIWYAIIPA